MRIEKNSDGNKRYIMEGDAYIIRKKENREKECDMMREENDDIEYITIRHEWDGEWWEETEVWREDAQGFMQYEDCPYFEKEEWEYLVEAIADEVENHVRENEYQKIYINFDEEKIKEIL